MSEKCEPGPISGFSTSFFEISNDLFGSPPSASEIALVTIERELPHRDAGELEELVFQGEFVILLSRNGKAEMIE